MEKGNNIGNDYQARRHYVFKQIKSHCQTGGGKTTFAETKTEKDRV